MSLFSYLLRIRGHAVWALPLSAQSVVVDGGAHCGEFSSEIYRRFGSHCIAVEANPVLAAKLQATPGGQVMHAALAATDGTAGFVFRCNPEGGSISARAADSGNATSLVEMVSLGTLMRRVGDPRIDVLKLDIEGAEFSLLEQTPDEILSGIAQITVEFHDFIPQFKGRRLFQAARVRLERLGFRCYSMAFRTHGDVLFLNGRSIHLTPAQRLGLSTLGRWVLKWRDRNGVLK